jgi:predicted permease
VLLFALGTGLGSALLFGCVPVLAAGRLGLASALHGGGRGGTVGPSAQRLRGALVVLNFALALALCVGGGLFFQSLRELARTDLGFRTERLLTWSMSLPDARYPDRPARAAFHGALLERLRALPGVAQVGLGSTIPLAGDGTDTTITIDGAPPLPPEQRPRLWYSVVSSQYLEAMGIDLLRGRAFTDADSAESGNVVVVNRAFAKAHFGGVDEAIGRRLVTGEGDKRTFWEIVGVAEDVRFFGVEQPQAPSAYLSLAQRPSGFFTVVLRASVDPEALVASIRREIAAIDPSLALANLRTMDGLVSDAKRGPTLIANLVGGFAVLALLLAAVGVYGVMTYAAERRTREFGVRLALGARRGALIGQVLRSGLLLAAIGIALGSVLALALGRAVQDLLYQVSPFEPAILATVAALLGATAVLATLAPALRASRVDPMDALREE